MATPSSLQCIGPTAPQRRRSIKISLAAQIPTLISNRSVRPKPHLLQVHFDHQSPALLGEKYPVLVDILNDDERDLEVVVDVLLQPAEDESGTYASDGLSSLQRPQTHIGSCRWQ